MDSIYPQLDHSQTTQSSAHGLRKLRAKNSAAVELLSELRRESGVRILLPRRGRSVGDAARLRHNPVFFQARLRKIGMPFSIGGQLTDEHGDLRFELIIIIKNQLVLLQLFAFDAGLAIEINHQCAGNQHQGDQLDEKLAAEPGNFRIGVSDHKF